MLSKQVLSNHSLSNGMRFLVALGDTMTNQYGTGSFIVDYYANPINKCSTLWFREYTCGTKNKVLTQPFKIELTPSLTQSFEKFINSEYQIYASNQDPNYETESLLLKNWFNTNNITFVSRDEFINFKNTFLKFVSRCLKQTSKLYKNLAAELENFTMAFQQSLKEQAYVEEYIISARRKKKVGL